MVFQAHEGALIERFSSASEIGTTGLDLDAAAIDSVGNHLQGLAEEGNKRGIQILVGMGNAEQLGGGLRGLNGVAAALQNFEKQKKREKQDAEARRLQILLGQLADIDAEIAGLREEIKVLDDKIDVLRDTMQGLTDGTLDVEDAITRPEVAEAIREWERRNPGKKFDKDAENAPEVLAEILAVQAGVYTDQRSELELRLDAAIERREEIINEIGSIDSNLALSIEQQRAQAAEFSSQNYVAADTVRAVTTTTEIESDAGVTREGYRGNDGALQAKHDEAANETAAIFGDDGALDFASADFGNQFASAVQPSVTEQEPQPATENTPKFETGMG